MAEIEPEVFTATLWFAVFWFIKRVGSALKRLKSDWDFLFGFSHLGACVRGLGAVEWDYTKDNRQEV